MAAELADFTGETPNFGIRRRHRRVRNRARAKSSERSMAEADLRSVTALTKSVGVVLHSTALHWLYSALAREDLGYGLCIHRGPSHVRYFCPKRFNYKWNATHGTAMNGLRRKGVKSKSRRVNRSCSGTAIGASVPSSRTSLPANDMRFTFQYSTFGDFLF